MDSKEGYREGKHTGKADLVRMRPGEEHGLQEAQLCVPPEGAVPEMRQNERPRLRHAGRKRGADNVGSL